MNNWASLALWRCNRLAVGTRFTPIYEVRKMENLILTCELVGACSHVEEHRDHLVCGEAGWLKFGLQFVLNSQAKILILGVLLLVLSLNFNLFLMENMSFG